MFHFADICAAFIMSNHVKPGDFTTGLDDVTNEAVRLAGGIICFSSACLGVMISRRVSLAKDEVELRSAPNSEMCEYRSSWFRCGRVPLRPRIAQLTLQDDRWARDGE